MRKIAILQTESGGRVVIRLDNWGNGIDKAFRRWVLDENGWHCLETREIAHEAVQRGFFRGLLYQAGITKP